MLMHRRFHKQQIGAVSMITVVFMAIILTVLTTSFIRLTIDEQREAIDNDLTTRAYYAAESGVQDAIIAIKNKTVNNPTICEPSNGAGTGVLSQEAGLDVEYTCQLIELTPSDFLVQLEKYRSEFFQLDDGFDGIESIKLSWQLLENSASLSLRSSGALLPKEVDWGSPAMIRLQIVQVPDQLGVSVSRDNITNFIIFLDPVAGTGEGVIGLGDSTIQDASCDLGTDEKYVCEYELGGLNDAEYDYYIRVQALYKETDIKIQALNSNQNAVSLLNEQAVVDVTGRAGDVYRRVESRVDITPDDLWPDYAVTSAQEICKNFTITDVAIDTNNPKVEVDFDGANTVIAGSCNGGYSSP